MALDDQGMAAAESIDGLIPLVPKGVLRESLKESLETYRDHPGPFFLEAALDRGYFQGLLEGVEALPREDREIVTPMVRQEVDIFHLMLLLRGRFHYGLARELLLPLHVAGAGISRALFIEMLDAQDLHASVDRAAGWVFDGTPPEDGSKSGSETAAFDAAVLERLAWKRFLRLANLAFRRSHMGLGAVIGYAGVRRVETANLITLSEGIRKGMDGATILARLIAPPGRRPLMFRAVPMTQVRVVVLGQDERAVLTGLGSMGAMQLTHTRSGPDTAPLAPRDRTANWPVATVFGPASRSCGERWELCPLPGNGGRRK